MAVVLQRILSNYKNLELPKHQFIAQHSYWSHHSLSPHLHNPQQVPNKTRITLPRLDVLDQPLDSIRSFPKNTEAIPFHSSDAYLCPTRNPVDQPLPGRRFRSLLKSRKARSNVKYTPEQVDCITYLRVDCRLRWTEVEQKFCTLFPGTRRGPQGLQGVYYRKNKQVPLTDLKESLIFDGGSNVETQACKVRNKKKPMGLLAVHPERALGYSWVGKDYAKQCGEIGFKRQAQLNEAEQRKRDTALASGYMADLED